MKPSTSILTSVLSSSLACSLIVFAFSPDIHGFMSRVDKQMASLENEINNGKPTGLEEIATNDRAADIVAYRLRFSNSLKDITPYITALSKELRQDLVEDLAYSNLAEAGGNQVEMRTLPNDKSLLRDRWSVNIEPDSHFDRNPAARLMFINESFPAPMCAEGFKPYIAYLPTSGFEVKFASETLLGRSTYRLTAWQGSSQIIDNVVDRVLVDAGCIEGSQSDSEATEPSTPTD